MSFQQQEQNPTTPTSPESDIGSTYSSPHRRHGQTRREALNRILKNRGGASNSTPDGQRLDDINEPPVETRTNGSLPSFPQDPNISPGTELSKRFIESMNIHSGGDNKSGGGGGGTTVTTATSSVSMTHPTGYSALPDDLSEKTPCDVKQVIDDGGGESSRQYGTVRQTTAQHLTTHEENEGDAKYYRITYPGVVALLSEPHRNSQKSGAYVSYGEIIMSRHEVNVDDEENTTLDSAMSANISPRSDAWTTHITGIATAVCSFANCRFRVITGYLTNSINDGTVSNYTDKITNDIGSNQTVGASRPSIDRWLCH